MLSLVTPKVLIASERQTSSGTISASLRKRLGAHLEANRMKIHQYRDVANGSQRVSQLSGDEFDKIVFGGKLGQLP